jgi:hypothetical protein
MLTRFSALDPETDVPARPDVTLESAGWDIEFHAKLRIDTPGEANHFGRVGIVQYVLQHPLQRAPSGADVLSMIAVEM